MTIVYSLNKNFSFSFTKRLSSNLFYNDKILKSLAVINLNFICTYILLIDFISVFLVIVLFRFFMLIVITALLTNVDVSINKNALV